MIDKSDVNKQYYQANKPYPIRLGDLKPKIQAEAFETDQSMHEVLRKIVEKHYEKESVCISSNSICEMARKAKEKMEDELRRIKTFGAKTVELHEKILSCNGSDFLTSSYKEMPELKTDIDLIAKSIKEKIEIIIDQLREEALSRNGIDLIVFSEKEIPALKTYINPAVQSVRKKVEKKVTDLKKELNEIQAMEDETGKPIKEILEPLSKLK